MKMLKSLFLLVALSLSLTSQAATASFNPTSITTTSVVANKNLAISSLTIANAAVTATTLGFFDTPNTNLTYSVGAYTNNVVTTGTAVVTFTNILGTVTSQTNAVVITTPTLVSATTGSYPKVLAYIVPASTTVTLPFNPAIYCASGLAITNSATNVIVSINFAAAQ